MEHWLKSRQSLWACQEIGAAFTDLLLSFCHCLTGCWAVNIVTDGSVEHLSGTALPLQHDTIVLLIVWSYTCHLGWQNKKWFGRWLPSSPPLEWILTSFSVWRSLVPMPLSWQLQNCLESGFRATSGGRGFLAKDLQFANAHAKKLLLEQLLVKK